MKKVEWALKWLSSMKLRWEVLNSTQIKVEEISQHWTLNVSLLMLHLVRVSRVSCFMSIFVLLLNCINFNHSEKDFTTRKLRGLVWKKIVKKSWKEMKMKIELKSSSSDESFLSNFQFSRGCEKCFHNLAKVLNSGRQQFLLSENSLLVFSSIKSVSNRK